MVLAIGNLIGGGQSPGASGTGSNNQTNSKEDETQATTGSSSSSSSTPATSGPSSSGKTETAVAVQPTPANQPAVKTDFGAAKNASEDVVDYPISGPDEFARLSAEMLREETVSSMLVEKIGERPEVADVGLDAEELRGPDEDQDADVAAVDDAEKADGTSEADEARSGNDVAAPTSEEAETQMVA